MSRKSKHARARQRAHDRRHLYRNDDLPRHAQIAVVQIEDPYAPAARVMADGSAEAHARLEPYVHNDGTTAEGAPSWTPPPRGMITVVQSLKNDPLGHMKARNQIDDAGFQAGREYQRCYVLTRIGSIRAVDMGATVTSSGNISGGLTDTQRHAAKLLARIDRLIVDEHGREALLLIRDVLGECLPIELAARHRGAVSDRETRWWGRLFRKGLDVIAIGFGFVRQP